VTAFDRAVKFLKNNDLCAVNFKISKNLSKEKDKRRSYASYENDEGSQVIGGAIYEADADLTHPLLYGYRTKTLPVFRADTLYLEVPQNVYAAPLIYKQNPLISGYANDKNKELAQGAASVVVSSVGSGKVIAMIENPTFRAFWYGTNKLLANMILFGNLVQSGTTEAMRTPASGGNR
jgi:hypothetical protein